MEDLGAVQQALWALQQAQDLRTPSPEQTSAVIHEQARAELVKAQATERAIGANEAKEKADKRAADIVEAYAKMRGKEEGQHKSTWKPKRLSPEIVDDWQCFKCDLSWYDCMVRKHIT